VGAARPAALGQWQRELEAAVAAGPITLAAAWQRLDRLAAAAVRRTVSNRRRRAAR